MILRPFARTACAVCAVVALSPALPAIAQVRPASPNGGMQRPPAANYINEMKALADTLSRQLQTRIVVDPMLVVPAKPTTPAQGLTVEKAMDALAAQGKRAAWRRVYVPQAQANALPPADRLAATVRMLELVEQNGLVIEDPAAKRATSFVKGFPTSAGFTEDLAAQQFSQAPVYVLYASALTAGGDQNQAMADRFMDLQRQQMQLMMQMTPDQMGQAMQQSMSTFMGMDPAMRQQFMGNMMRAGMQMFQNMSPDQRQELINMAMQGAQGVLGAGGQGGPNRP